MNKYLKTFILRGLIFGAGGPVIVGIVLLILDLTVGDIMLTGREICITIVSSYLLAFVHAGASIFPSMDTMPIAKSALLHFGTLYVAYTACYLVNSWIEFKPLVLLIYTAVFVAIYLSVWLIVILSLRCAKKNINAHLGE